MTRTGDLIVTLVLCVASVECHDWTAECDQDRGFIDICVVSSAQERFRCAQELSEPCPHRRRGPVSQLPSVTRETYFRMEEKKSVSVSVRTLKCAPISQQISEIRHLWLVKKN